jgi:hypothetical protein
MGGRIFPIETHEQISFVMDNAHLKNCRSQTGCRCYRPPRRNLIIERHRD